MPDRFTRSRFGGAEGIQPAAIIFASEWFMAGEEGFEPSNGGFKGRCLTTWRLPNTVRKIWSWSALPLLPGVVSAERSEAGRRHRWRLPRCDPYGTRSRRRSKLGIYRGIWRVIASSLVSNNLLIEFVNYPSNRRLYR